MRTGFALVAVVAAVLLGLLYALGSAEITVATATGVLTVLGPSFFAVRQYRKTQAESSTTAAAQLLNEIIGFVEEIDDILQNFAPDPVYAEWSQSLYPNLDFQAAEIGQMRRTGRGPGRLFKHEGAGPEAARAESEERWAVSFADLEGAQMVGNTSAYDKTITMLRTVASRKGWAKALFATARFYEQKDYCATILERVRRTLQAEFRTSTSGQERFELSRRQEDLLKYYFTRLLLLNRYYGPEAICSLARAYERNLSEEDHIAEVRVKVEEVRRQKKAFEEQFGALLQNLG